MRGNRLFVSVAAIALVAGPGLAMAQSGPPSETPPVDTPTAETPPVETPPVDEGSPVETPPFETPPVDTPEAAEEAEDLPETEEVEAEDEGENEVISALAACLPSGAELHGTGFNKGFIMSQAATEGEVMLGEGDEALPVVSPGDAEALCDIVQDLADQAEAPETAKGRPDWAGPKGTDEGEVSPADRRGPPAHANAGGSANRGGASDDS